MLLRFTTLVGVSILSGCLDVSLPSTQRPGSVTLTATLAGNRGVTPASGAVLELVGTEVRAVADAEGNVALTGLTTRRGQLRLSATVPDTGEVYERVFDLERSNLGSGRDASLGVITLGRRASVVGFARRGDRPPRTGHAGIQVFVAGSSLLTSTADDGYFSLALPEGQVTVTVFTAGYAPVQVPLELNAAEERRLTTVELQVAAGAPTGRVFGRIVTSGRKAVPQATVRAGPLSATTGDDGRFELTAVPRGLVTVRASAAEFKSNSLENLYFDGVELDVGDLLLVPGVDAVADAGVADGGTRFTPLDRDLELVTVFVGVASAGPGNTWQIPPPTVAITGDLVILASEVTAGLAGPAGQRSDWAALNTQQIGTNVYELAWRFVEANERQAFSTYRFTLNPAGRVAFAMAVYRHAGAPRLTRAVRRPVQGASRVLVPFPQQPLARGEVALDVGVVNPAPNCAPPLEFEGDAGPQPSTFTQYDGLVVFDFQGASPGTVPAFSLSCACAPQFAAEAIAFQLVIPPRP